MLEHCLLHIRNEGTVIPKLLKPFEQVRPVTVGIYYNIEFDVVGAFSGVKPEAGDSEIGAAKKGVRGFPVLHVVKLSVKETGSHY